MKLTQELIVASVFLIGSWVTLSVVASAFPPSSSSIRKAFTAAPAAMQAEAPITIEPSATAAPEKTYLIDEKEPLVQVVSGDAEKNELFILGEKEVVSEKVIEKNPQATLAVLGGEEKDVSQKIEKFNIAAKNVAVRIALTKQEATYQAEADYKKLHEWTEKSRNFQLEVQAKKFELPLPQLLSNSLQRMAEEPEVTLPNTGLQNPVEEGNVNADASKQQKKKTILSSAVPVSNNLTPWKDRHLQTALRMAADSAAKPVICKQTVEYVTIRPQQTASIEKVIPQIPRTIAAVSKPVPAMQPEVSRPVPVSIPALPPVDESMALNLKPAPFKLQSVLATLAADTGSRLPLGQAVMPVQQHAVHAPEVKPAAPQLAALRVTIKPEGSAQQAARMAVASSQKKMASAAKTFNYNKPFKPVSHQLTELELRQFAQAMPAPRHKLSNVIVVAASSPDARPLKLTVPAATQARHAKTGTAGKLAALPHAQASHREKMAARERALANLERQLATEPMIVTPPPVVERRIAEAKPEVRHSTSFFDRFRRKQAPVPQQQARRRSYGQPKPVTEKPQRMPDNDFGDASNFVSNSSSRTHQEEMSHRLHDPGEYNKLMEE